MDFFDELESKYGKDKPILTSEILDQFSIYTRAYVFRLIGEEVKRGRLACLCRGVYFIPRKTFFGMSTVSPEMVAEKEYVSDNDTVYGVYSGQTLINMFGISTQIPATREIVTNNEATRKRTIQIAERDFIVRKSRCEITSANHACYTLAQLFNDMNERDLLDGNSVDTIRKYIKTNGITRAGMAEVLACFPAKTSKRIMCSGVLNGIA